MDRSPNQVSRRPGPLATYAWGALAVTTLLTACTAAPSPPPAGEGPTPPLSPSFAGRQCQAADLRAEAGPIGIGLGNLNLPVTLTNTSGKACVLAGYPSLAGVRSDGSTEPIAVSYGSYFGDPGQPGILSPGEVGAVNISGGDGCPAYLSASRVYPLLEIGLPAGGHVEIRGGSFDAICGVAVSAFGVLGARPGS